MEDHLLEPMQDFYCIVYSNTTEALSQKVTAVINTHKWYTRTIHNLVVTPNNRFYVAIEGKVYIN